MKLEIDIPSILYQDAKENGNYISVTKLEIAWKAIADGKPLEQEPTTKIEESNFSQEQYLADLQGAYDCGKSVIDKIRAEILDNAFKVVNPNNTYKYINVLDLGSIEKILDKYKTESEGKEAADD